MIFFFFFFEKPWQSMIGRRIYSEKQKLSSYGIIGGIIFIVYQS